MERGPQFVSFVASVHAAGQCPVHPPQTEVLEFRVGFLHRPVRIECKTSQATPFFSSSTLCGSEDPHVFRQKCQGVNPHFVAEHSPIF